MKRTVIFTTVILLAAGIAYLAFAAEHPGEMMSKEAAEKPMMEKQGMMMGQNMMGQGMMGMCPMCQNMMKMMGKDGMMGRGMMGMGMGMCPVHTMMGQCMMSREIVATEDGGVIVMAGNKLLKYDKNLEFVKEVELKIDMQATQSKMQQMMKE
jgi:hypothetical protein